MIEQLRGLGVPEEAWPVELLDGVPRSAAPAIRLAAAAWTQWRWVPGMAPSPIGLDRQAVLALAPVVGVTVTEHVLRDLGYLEAGAIQAMTEDAR